MRTCRWSCSSAPTPGMSATRLIPHDLSSAAGPSPDSCRSCGELNAPPATMTSALACAMRVAPPHRYSTPMARRPETRIRLASAFGTMARLAQIADRGRAPTPTARGQLEITGAFLGGPVEIIVARKARLLRGRDESLAQRMRFAHVGHRERPVHPMQRILAARLVLGAAKVGQHILEAPAGIAELTPMIEVGRLAAEIEQAVDRARAAQHLPPRLDDLPVVELGLRLRRVEPIDLTIGEQLAVAERDVNPDMAVMAARLQQQNAMAARGGQTIGENAAGASGADDDIVKGVRVRLHRLASRALNSRTPRANFNRSNRGP